MARLKHIGRDGRFKRTERAPTQGTARDQPLAPVAVDPKEKELSDAKAEIQRLEGVMAKLQTNGETLEAANKSLDAAVKRLQQENKKLSGDLAKAEKALEAAKAKAAPKKPAPKKPVAKKAAPKKRTSRK